MVEQLICNLKTNNNYCFPHSYVYFFLRFSFYPEIAEQIQECKCGDTQHLFSAGSVVYAVVISVRDDDGRSRFTAKLASK